MLNKVKDRFNSWHPNYRAAFILSWLYITSFALFTFPVVQGLAILAFLIFGCIVIPFWFIKDMIT